MLVHAASIDPRRRALLRPQFIAAGPPASGFIPGPTGLKKPWNWTYAYDKAATVTVTTFAGLQAAINDAARAPGDVIEFSGSIAGTESTPALLTAPTGRTGWAAPILVRPPIGSRMPIASLNLTADQVIIAGGDFSGRIGLSAVNTASPTGGAYGSGFWRCVATTPGAWIPFTGGNRASLVECVQPHRMYRAGGDRVDIYAHGSANTINPQIDGNWIAGGLVGPGANKDYVHLTERTNVTAGTFTVTATATASDSNTLLVALKNLPAGASATLTITHASGGGVIWTGTVPGTASECGDVQDYKYINNLTGISLTNGETVNIAVSSIVGTIPSLEVWLGNYNGAVDTHCDSMQWGISSTGAADGSNVGALVRDNVIQGSGGSTCIIGDYMKPDEDFRWIRNWFGVAQQCPSGSFNMGAMLSPNRSSVFTATEPFLRTHWVDNHFHAGAGSFTGGGAIDFATTPWIVTFLGNVFGEVTALGAHADASNVTGATMTAPVLPDLATLWPECPITVSN